jgi:hypothetical protein
MRSLWCKVIAVRASSDVPTAEGEDARIRQAPLLKSSTGRKPSLCVAAPAAKGGIDRASEVSVSRRAGGQATPVAQANDHLLRR